jgi:hypothetical protein
MATSQQYWSREAAGAPPCIISNITVHHLKLIGLSFVITCDFKFIILGENQIQKKKIPVRMIVCMAFIESNLSCRKMHRRILKKLKYNCWLKRLH